MYRLNNLKRDLDVERRSLKKHFEERIIYKFFDNYDPHNSVRILSLFLIERASENLISMWVLAEMIETYGCNFAMYCVGENQYELRDRRC